MEVRSVMTPNPACCGPDSTLQHAAQLMQQHDCGQIPVVGDGRLVGVITDRDIAVRAVAQGSDAGAKVGDYMTSPVTTVKPDCTLEDCCNLMESNQIRRVVVVDDKGGVAGIVAQADVALSGRDAKTAEMVKEVSEPARH